MDVNELYKHKVKKADSVLQSVNELFLKAESIQHPYEEHPNQIDGLIHRLDKVKQYLLDFLSGQLNDKKGDRK